MSQGNGLAQGSYELDGTLMRGCIANNCQVATNTVGAVNWSQWSAIVGNTNQQVTGYRPDGKDRQIGNHNAAGAHYIVDFPSLPVADRNRVLPARYNTEAIDINLERHVRVAGRLIVPQRR